MGEDPAGPAARITPETRLKEALDLGPEVLGYVIALNPRDFGRLRNPMMRRLMSPRISLGRVAAMAGVPVRGMLENIAALGGTEVGGLEEGRHLPRSAHRKPGWVRSLDPERVPVVDLLPLDDALSGDPMPHVVRGVKALAVGEVLLIRHRWEPQPFYDVWTKMGGLEWYSERVGESLWWIWVLRAGGPNGGSGEERS